MMLFARPLTVVCRDAVEISKKVGVRIHWRPNGIEYWKTPEMDTAVLLED